MIISGWFAGVTWTTLPARQGTLMKYSDCADSAIFVQATAMILKIEVSDGIIARDLGSGIFCIFFWKNNENQCRKQSKEKLKEADIQKQTCRRVKELLLALSFPSTEA